ncbi:MAG: mechanosensitive ion channel family protein [Cyanophyceae cyanobacterium]
MHSQGKRHRHWGAITVNIFVSLGLGLGLWLWPAAIAGTKIGVALAQDAAAPSSLLPGLGAPSSAAPAIAPVVVSFNGETLFEIRETFGALSRQDRADRLTAALHTVADDRTLNLDQLTTAIQDDTTYITLGSTPLMAVSAADAAAANRTVDQLAQEYIEILRPALERYRLDRSPDALIKGLIGTAIATVLTIVILVLVTRSFRQADRFVARLAREGARQRAFSHPDRDRRRTPRPPKLNLARSRQSLELLAFLIRTVRLFTLLGLLGSYGLALLSLFPWTKGLYRSLTQSLLQALGGLLSSILGYLPNVFIIGVIIGLIYYSLQIIHPFFKGIERGTITFNGFYSEWAQPTYRILEFFIISLGVVMVFPYLPGFGSSAFQGVSIMLGVLVSLGSTAAVSNAVAGIILIYTRAFQIGDLVQISDAFGTIEEKLLLVTRIRTFENVIITVPNSSLLDSNIVNYSASIRDTNIPVALELTLTLGYDVPWRLVHGVLMAAARATEGACADVEPEVEQKALGDFSVTYEVSVFTRSPERYESIISSLCKNIQDHCNGAGIEILSPAYSAIRDGNTTTMPESYRPAGYESPGFQLNPLGNLFQIDLKMAANPKPKSTTTAARSRPGSSH